MNSLKKIFFFFFLAASVIFTSCEQNSLLEFATEFVDPDEKIFTSFSLNGSNGSIDNYYYKIDVTVPYGTDLTSLVPYFSIRGDHIEMNGVEVISGSTAINFSSSVMLSVFAQNDTYKDYYVNVSTGSNIPVTGVTLNKESTTILVNASEQLQATVYPTNASNQTVYWSSNDPSIATVDSGVVTGISAGGPAYITVSTADGGFTANCIVTVSGTSIPVTGVSLAPTSITLVAGTSNNTLTAVITPSDATNKNLIWTSSNEAVATVSTSGVVSALANSYGTTIITVTTENGGYTATCNVDVWYITAIPSSMTLSLSGTNYQSYIIYAHYSDASSADVTSSCANNISPAGSVGVTTGMITAISYIGSDIVVTASYYYNGLTATTDILVTVTP